ncbi:MAG TPA: FAD-dependent oxidoreductase, partial [Acidothermaceae bacterium]|nr:FAD-dependent oxidoreductase [Acidothermaceae bacterium]
MTSTTSRNSPVERDKTKRGVVCWRSIAIMADVNYCVVGAGFAGLTAALRLKQAGESVALLEAR